jgi:acetoin utilization protein AcuB
MFTWYIRGAPRTYEIPLSHSVSSVTATNKIHGIDNPAATPEVVESESHVGIKGYSDAKNSPLAERRQVLRVKEIMSAPVQVVAPDDSMEKVSRLFSTKKVRHAPVCDSKGKLCGIASERDLLRKMVADRPDPFIEVPPPVVGDFMKHKVLTASPEAEIRFAARIMFSEKIGCLPVVDEKGSVVGIVTRSDILKTVMNVVPLELWT